MSDQPSDLTPWTIKSVNPETRQKAVRAAKQADQTMGEWITEMVNRATDPHLANLVIPPSKPEPVLMAQAVPNIDFTGMSVAFNAAVAARKESGKPVPASWSENFHKKVLQLMSAAGGLPDGGRQTTKQTLLLDGQTISQDHDKP